MRLVAFGRMKAYAYRKFGGPQRIIEVSRAEPKVRRNDVLVQVHSIGLNPLDSRLRQGQMWPATALSGARLIGSDFSGTVLSVGAGVVDIQPGERVCGMVNQFRAGTSAERISAPRRHLTRTADCLSDSEAAALPLAGLTAFQALRKVREVMRGEQVLIHGASGGVGSFAVQLARIAGAHVTAVTSHRNVDWMPELGAHTTIDYTKQDVRELPLQLDTFFDCVGHLSFGKTRHLLKRDGTYITTIPNVRTLGTSLGNTLRAQKNNVVLVQSRSDHLAMLMDYVTEGLLKPVVERSYLASEIQEAYAHLDSHRAKGKITVQIGC
jgi:NADPH:quinone reductase-like Zn-dependent oxidoreductase